MSTPAPTISAAIVLAAGAARRFGSPKQLARLSGEPLVVRACRAALDAALAPVVVVLGAHADVVGPALADLPVTSIVNPNWREGMGTSLRAGAADLLARHGPCECAVLLADQPLVDADHLRALRALRRDHDAPVAATRYQERLGVPAVFAPALLAALTALSGDVGARDLIRSTDAVLGLALREASLDVDTPADLARAQQIARDD